MEGGAVCAQHLSLTCVAGAKVGISTPSMPRKAAAALLALAACAAAQVSNMSNSDDRCTVAANAALCSAGRQPCFDPTPGIPAGGRPFYCRCRYKIKTIALQKYKVYMGSGRNNQAAQCNSANECNTCVWKTNARYFNNVTWNYPTGATLQTFHNIADRDWCRQACFHYSTCRAFHWRASTCVLSDTAPLACNEYTNVSGSSAGLVSQLGFGPWCPVSACSGGPCGDSDNLDPGTWVCTGVRPYPVSLAGSGQLECSIPLPPSVTVSSSSAASSSSPSATITNASNSSWTLASTSTTSAATATTGWISSSADTETTTDAAANFTSSLASTEATATGATISTTDATAHFNSSSTGTEAMTTHRATTLSSPLSPSASLRPVTSSAESAALTTSSTGSTARTPTATQTPTGVAGSTGSVSSSPTPAMTATHSSVSTSMRTSGSPTSPAIPPTSSVSGLHPSSSSATTTDTGPGVGTATPSSAEPDTVEQPTAAPRGMVGAATRRSTDAASAAGLIGSLVGGAGMATHGGRAVMIQSMACRDVLISGETEALEWEMHPTGVAWPGVHQGLLIGASVANPLLVLAFAVALFAAASLARFCLNRTGYSWTSAFGLCRFPSLAYLPYLFLLQGTSYTAGQLALASYIEIDVGYRVLGAVVLASCCALPLLVYHLTLHRLADKVVLVPNPLAESDGKPKLQRLRRAVYAKAFGRSMWVSRGTGFCEQQGVVFDTLRDGAAWYCVFEMLHTVCLSLLLVWKPMPSTECTVRNVCVCVVCGLLLLVLVVFTPFLAPLDNMMLMAIAALLTAAAAVITHAIHSDAEPTSALYDAAGYAIFCANVLVMFKAVWDLVWYIGEMCVQRGEAEDGRLLPAEMTPVVGQCENTLTVGQCENTLTPLFENSLVLTPTHPSSTHPSSAFRDVATPLGCQTGKRSRPNMTSFRGAPRRSLAGSLRIPSPLHPAQMDVSVCLSPIERPVSPRGRPRALLLSDDGECDASSLALAVVGPSPPTSPHGRGRASPRSRHDPSLTLM